MTTVCVIVPTRGRPASVRRLMEAFASTGASADLWLGVDDDDETAEDFSESGTWGDVDLIVTVSPRTSMVGTLNAIAVQAADIYDIVGFMGDDHLPVTDCWDKRISNSLNRTGIAYGNDLMQGQNLPTAVFLTADIVRTLGYMVPPTFAHLYADNVWKDWGQGIHRFTYLPDVIIEHLHPQAGKAEWDENYGRVNGGAMWEHDADAYRVYCEGQRALDLAKLNALI